MCILSTTIFLDCIAYHKVDRLDDLVGPLSPPGSGGAGGDGGGGGEAQGRGGTRHGRHGGVRLGRDKADGHEECSSL